MIETAPILKAPFPAFGGKSKVADVVWSRLGTGPDRARNYIEPFAFSAAVLLRRPMADVEGAVETINDRNNYVSNFWRAVHADPEKVAYYADWPVNEVDLHARHKWLLHSNDARAKLAKVGEDPEAYDAKIAGWWCWGACCWIGAGWCDETSERWSTLEVAEWRSGGVANSRGNRARTGSGGVAEWRSGGVASKGSIHCSKPPGGMCMPGRATAGMAIKAKTKTANESPTKTRRGSGSGSRRTV